MFIGVNYPCLVFLLNDLPYVTEIASYWKLACENTNSCWFRLISPERVA